MKKLFSILILLGLSGAVFPQAFNGWRHGTPPPTLNVFVASSSSPSDNGTSTTTPVAVAVHGSAVAGDLLVFIVGTRAAATWSVSNTGGQTWAQAAIDLEGVGITGTDVAVFYATYNGTVTGGNPSIACVGGDGGRSGIILVFRPGSAGANWAIDQALAETDFTATTTVTVPAQTTANASTVSLAIWSVPDDVSWTNLAGAGWVVGGVDQYRNTSGNDLSLSFAYKLQNVAGSTGTVSKDQGTNGPDAGTSGMITFRNF